MMSVISEELSTFFFFWKGFPSGCNSLFMVAGWSAPLRYHPLTNQGCRTTPEPNPSPLRAPPRRAPSSGSWAAGLQASLPCSIQEMRAGLGPGTPGRETGISVPPRREALLGRCAPLPYQDAGHLLSSDNSTWTGCAALPPEGSRGGVSSLPRGYPKPWESEKAGAGGGIVRGSGACLDQEPRGGRRRRKGGARTRGSHRARPGGRRSPASRPGTGPSARAAGTPTPPGRSTRPRPRTARLRASGHQAASPPVSAPEAGLGAAPWGRAAAACSPGLRFRRPPGSTAGVRGPPSLGVGTERAGAARDSGILRETNKNSWVFIHF